MTGILVIKFLRKNMDFTVVNFFFALVLRLLNRTDIFLNTIWLLILKFKKKCLLASLILSYGIFISGTMT